MPCENYQNALVEAAATGAEPQSELRAHLAACAACHATFAQEQALFSSIDAGLHVAANAEVPASLLPRVRARLDEEFAPRRTFVTNWLVLASAAVVIITLFAARAAWHLNVEQNPGMTSVRTNSPGPVILPSQSPGPPSVPLPKKEIVSPSRSDTARNSASPERLAVRNATLEVLVPRDQEDLLVSYAQQWSQRKRAPLVAANFDATNMSPLQISPIQIAQLDVKLMTEEQAQ